MTFDTRYAVYIPSIQPKRAVSDLQIAIGAKVGVWLTDVSASLAVLGVDSRKEGVSRARERKVNTLSL